MVLYNHGHYQWYPAIDKAYFKFNNLAHAAVVVFFVLSGYVIAYTTTQKNRGAFQYALARLSRLSSVVIPAVLTTMVIELIVLQLNPSLHAQYARDAFITRYLLSGFFLNEIWFLSAAPLFNIALWSLSYEFWYYTIFGFWFFRKPGWKSLCLAIGASVFAGPKILLMMPIWLCGYIACRLRKPVFGYTKAWFFVFLVLIATGLSINFLPPFPFRLGFKPLFFANEFLTDWIIGILLAFAIWLLPAKRNSLVKPEWVHGFRKVANLTFPLYVFHYPLFILYRCVFGFTMNSEAQLWEAILSVTLFSVIIGFFLDKQRYLWDNLFRWLLNLIKNFLLI